MFDAKRFCLGTVQFGLKYGIANQTGKPTETDVREIIARAVELGIYALDTAQVYGDSEIRLGKIFQDLEIQSQVKCTTKLAPGLSGETPEFWLKSIASSLENLKLEHLDCLMLHDSQMMRYWEKGLGEAIKLAIDKQWVRQFGISVYSPAEIEQWKHIEMIRCFQVPSNILDRRFILNGYFEKNSHHCFFIRSVFLQGLLLLSEQDLEEKFVEALPYVKKLQDFCQEHGVAIKSFVAGYIISRTKNAIIVFGIDHLSQLNENVYLYQQPSPEMEQLFDLWDQIAVTPPEKVINPSMWD